MILGIGIDLVDMRRIEAVCERHGERFVRRILTPVERGVYQAYTGQRQLQYLAGRFAIKEAVAKAFGTGIGRCIGWQDVETMQAGGRPAVVLSEDAKRRLSGCFSAQNGSAQKSVEIFSSREAHGTWERVTVHVSLSHERNHLVAQALVEAG